VLLGRKELRLNFLARILRWTGRLPREQEAYVFVVNPLFPIALSILPIGDSKAVKPINSGSPTHNFRGSARFALFR
jgi:hypothetical protein